MTLDCPRALIADDQADVTEALRLLLKREGFQTEAVHSPSAVLESLSSENFDLVLMDLNYAKDTTSGEEGLDLLGRIGQAHQSVPVVVMTAWGNVPLAVEAMKRGARDFVEKPWDNRQLLSTLRRQIGGRAQTEREQIRDAVDAQQALLPRTIPQIPGYDLALAWTPARDVSGDYVDLIPLGDTRLGVAVGDVAGKGVAAALLMANLQAAMRTLAPEHAAPADLMTRVNRTVSANVTSNRFITLFYGIVEGRRLTYANAGHLAPILVHADGGMEMLDAGGPVLGVFGGLEYTQAECELHTGDRLVIFTDGVVEAEDSSGGEYGAGRLAELVVARRAQDAAQLRQAIMDDLTRFTAGPLEDDATLLLLAVQ